MNDDILDTDIESYDDTEMMYCIECLTETLHTYDGDCTECYSVPDLPDYRPLDFND